MYGNICFICIIYYLFKAKKVHSKVEFMYVYVGVYIRLAHIQFDLNGILEKI